MTNHPSQSPHFSNLFLQQIKKTTAIQLLRPGRRERATTTTPTTATKGTPFAGRSNSGRRVAYNYKIRLRHKIYAIMRWWRTATISSVQSMSYTQLQQNDRGNNNKHTHTVVTATTTEEFSSAKTQNAKPLPAAATRTRSYRFTLTLSK